MALVADVHIGADDPELPPFLAFLAERAADTELLVLLGDVFSLWLGLPKYTAPHHAAVLDACRALRRAGVRVVFVEGNREFAVRCWEGDAFDEVCGDLAAEPWAGRRWYLAHGDLLNREDRRGRAFRRVVRSPFVTTLLHVLPARAGLALAARIERALRHRNLAHKRSIPGERFARYARWFEGQGFDAGAIGHIHVELALELADPHGAPRTLYVLPDWRSTHRWLRVPRAGEPRFIDWGPPRPVAPAIVEVRDDGDTLRVRLDRDVPVETGAPIRVSSGHGPEARRGVVGAIDAADPRSLTLRLEPGPPLQVGDRVEFTARGC